MSRRVILGYGGLYGELCDSIDERLRMFEHRGEIRNEYTGDDEDNGGFNFFLNMGMAAETEFEMEEET